MEMHQAVYLRASATVPAGSAHALAKEKTESHGIVGVGRRRQQRRLQDILNLKASVDSVDVALATTASILGYDAPRPLGELSNCDTVEPSRVNPMHLALWLSRSAKAIGDSRYPKSAGQSFTRNKKRSTEHLAHAFTRNYLYLARTKLNVPLFGNKSTG